VAVKYEPMFLLILSDINNQKHLIQNHIFFKKMVTCTALVHVNTSFILVQDNYKEAFFNNLEFDPSDRQWDFLEGRFWPLIERKYSCEYLDANPFGLGEEDVDFLITLPRSYNEVICDFPYISPIIREAIQIRISDEFCSVLQGQILDDFKKIKF